MHPDFVRLMSAGHEAVVDLSRNLQANSFEHHSGGPAAPAGLQRTQLSVSHLRKDIPLVFEGDIFL